jgi:hypothetical protein
MITTYENFSAHKVDFSELYSKKNQITSMLLMWDYNSYYVNITNKYFIINGGNRIRPTIMETMEQPVLEYARRNRANIEINVESTKNGKVEISYLIGVTGLCDGTAKSILLHISETGDMWMWKEDR